MGPHIANVERAPCDLQLIGYLIGWLDTEGQSINVEYEGDTQTKNRNWRT